MVEEKVCIEMMKRVDAQLSDNEKLAKKNSSRLDMVEQELVGMKKDTKRLEEIMTELKKSIDNLNNTILEIKLKPLSKYDQVLMVAITLVMGYVFSQITRR